MGRRARAGLQVVFAAGAFAGCARYQPRPIDPAAHPREVRARRLDDPVLLNRVMPYAGRPDSTRWTDRQLAVAALLQRTELARGRAEWHTALAAVRTAGGRPQPGVESSVERRVGGRDEGAPWVVSLTALTTVELGGKRGARLLAARSRAAAAESRLALSAFGVAREVRIGAAALAAAAAGVEESRVELAALQRVARLERERYVEAALASSELARTASEVQDARAALAESERALLSARAALAGTLAVPVVAVENLEPLTASTAGCAWLDSVSVDSVAFAALRQRAEVTTALAGYTVAEADMRLEVARRHPDLEIGPGFIWDQGVHRWTLALALPSLLGFRNQGPLAEADAAREVAGLRVAETQDSVIAEVEAAAQECRGSRLALVAADSQVAAARAIVARARAAYDRGETASLEPARAELQLVRAEGIRSATARRLTMAGLTLETAAGDWHDGDGRPWPDPRHVPGQESETR